ncbi:MAG: hypothetical protein M3Y21_06250 [Candidatus Eremiobacteraeota bacterium]|nr:hypothetical protein [Candidatus Eremiobacteraeota bacterium]
MPTSLAVDSTVTLLPKNRGLAVQALRAFEGRHLTQRSARSVRGEDIPYLSSAIAAGGSDVLAFTGEDLLEEWLAGGNTLDKRLCRGQIAWADPAAIYGKPALCLIGKPGSARITPTDRIAVCAQYRNLAARYLRQSRGDRGRAPILLSGTVEASLYHGIADFIIDIVVTGQTLRAAQLAVLDIIFKSDLAVLETQKA